MTSGKITYADILALFESINPDYHKADKWKLHPAIDPDLAERILQYHNPTAEPQVVLFNHSLEVTGTHDLGFVAGTKLRAKTEANYSQGVCGIVRFVIEAGDDGEEVSTYMTGQIAWDGYAQWEIKPNDLSFYQPDELEQWCEMMRELFRIAAKYMTSSEEWISQIKNKENDEG